MEKLNKHPNHDHYFISEGILCECYRTIRGIRYMELKTVDAPDQDKCTDEEVRKHLTLSEN